jgi:hypothetical protein
MHSNNGIASRVFALKEILNRSGDLLSVLAFSRKLGVFSHSRDLIIAKVTALHN